MRQSVGPTYDVDTPDGECRFALLSCVLEFTFRQLVEFYELHNTEARQTQIQARNVFLKRLSIGMSSLYRFS